MPWNVSFNHVRIQISRVIENSWLGKTRFGRWLVKKIPPGRVQRQTPVPAKTTLEPAPTSLSQRTVANSRSDDSKQTSDTPGSQQPLPGISGSRSQQAADLFAVKSSYYRSLIQRYYNPQANYSPYPVHKLQSPEQQLETMLKGGRPLAVINGSETDFLALEHALQSNSSLACQRIPGIDQPGEKLLIWRTDDQRSPGIAQRYQELLQRWQTHYTRNLEAGSPPDEARLRADIRVRNRLMTLEGVLKTDRQKAVSDAKARLAGTMADSVPGSPDDGAIYSGKVARQLIADCRMQERLLDPQQLLHAVQAHNPGQPSESKEVIQREINAYQQMLLQPVPDQTAGIERVGRTIMDKQRHILDLITALEKKGQKLNDQNMLLDHELVLVLQVMNDPGTPELQGKLSWKEAVEFKRVGYDLDPDVTRITFRDTDLNPDKAVTRIGNGFYNTVYAAEYQTSSGSYEAVIKPEHAKDDGVWDAIVSQDRYFDKKTPHFTLRNIASRIVDRYLGTSLVPNVHFAMHNDRLCMVMDKAPGSTGGSCQVGSERRLNAFFSNNHHVSGAIKNKIAANLCDLEWLDALLAQPDRHYDNIMIDYTTGQVTGIDNDVCLYPYHGIIDRSESDQYALFPKGCRVGRPTLINRSMYQQLEQLDIDHLCQELEDKTCLTAEEQEALRVRYQLLMEHARSLAQKGMVVDDWTTWRCPGTDHTALQHQFGMDQHPDYKATRQAFMDFLKPGRSESDKKADRQVLLNNPQYVYSNYLRMCAG